jgi:integrase
MLLKVCAGRGFDQRRDTALILFLLDIGGRRSEAANMEVSDLDWDLRWYRWSPRGAVTAPSLSAPRCYKPWTATSGPETGTGRRAAPGGGLGVGVG